MAIAWSRPLLATPTIAAGATPAPTASAPAFWIIYESPEWSFERPVELLIMLLGGVEVSTAFGAAQVESGARDDAGAAMDVASGSASVVDWGIGLYWAPSATGFFARPTLGYLSQDIGIADFRADLPTVSVPGATEIAGTCTNLDTGAALACDAPNRYALAIGSGQLGVSGGYGFVAGNDTIHVISHVAAGVNVVELRSVTATIADYTTEQTDFAFLRALNFEGSVGVHLPAYHWSVRLATTYRQFFEFAYGEPLRFHGPVSFDVDAQTYVRRLVRVERVSLGSWNIQIATAFVF